jgi:hypothetical protein
MAILTNLLPAYPFNRRVGLPSKRRAHPDEPCRVDVLEPLVTGTRDDGGSSLVRGDISGKV